MVKCGYCEMDFNTQPEAYILLTVHQIIRHGQDCNERDGLYYKEDF